MTELAGLDDQLTFEQADALFKEGAMGVKEYRSWLANRYQDFAKIRDQDVDDGIVLAAKLRQQRLEEEAKVQAL